MPTTDQHPTDRSAVNDARLAITDMIIGLKKLSDWIGDHPACVRPRSFSATPDRYLVYCSTRDEFFARLADLEDGAPGGLARLVDDNYVSGRRDFGGGVVADVYMKRDTAELMAAAVRS